MIVGLAVVVLCAGCGPGASFAAAPSTVGESKVGRITVSGNAQVRVVPDEVILTVGVETVDLSMNVAKGENDVIVGRVLDLVGDYGVEDKVVQTDFISIEPRYDTYYERKNFLGYFVRKNVAITLRDLTQFEGLLSALLNAGVTHVHGIDFRSTALRQHRDEARALAVQAASEKAAAMATELGQDVGRPVLIREERSDWNAWYSSWWGSSWVGAMSQNVVQNSGSGEPFTDGALAPGQIAINAQVSVTFELVE
jgi:uncharacterized protein YggE